MQLRRKIATIVAAGTLCSAVGLVLSPSPAQAHGAIMEPGSRTYLCWLDSKTPNGQAVPTNPACAAAIAKSGPTPLYNWFAVLRGDGGGRTTGFIPDGKLCSGDARVYDFSGFDLARDDWPVTHLDPGGDFAWKYSNWAHHPGTFRMFVTKDSWSPTRALAWSDLESAPFLSVTNPPQKGASGNAEGHYYWSGKLPANKTGRHIIYTTWTRSDSQETFYNCSDVVFEKGAKGEVSGIRKPGSSPSPDPVSPSPETSESPDPSTSPSPGGTASCAATYQTVTAWGDGFQGQLVIRNTGTAPLTAWSAHWMFDSSQKIAQSWNAVVKQEASHVTASPMPYNRTIEPGKSTTLGFNGKGTAPTTMLTPACLTS